MTLCIRKGIRGHPIDGEQGWRKLYMAYAGYGISVSLRQSWQVFLFLVLRPSRHQSYQLVDR
jgi:hypothetical protein